VSRWFREHTQYNVEAESLGADLERLVLRPLRPGHDVPFPDAGEGLQQVFPVIVGLERLRRRGGLLAIEEPESHLHPRLQKALAARMVAILTDQPLAKVLLETHSEVFLLAALAAATDGLVGQVGLYWTEVNDQGAGHLERIHLDSDGYPKTPRLEQAFGTMGVMRRELMAARRAKADT
jgi:predicted ATPase